MAIISAVQEALDAFKQQTQNPAMQAASTWDQLKSQTKSAFDNFYSSVYNKAPAVQNIPQQVKTSWQDLQRKVDQFLPQAEQKLHQGIDYLYSNRPSGNLISDTSKNLWKGFLKNAATRLTVGTPEQHTQWKALTESIYDYDPATKQYIRNDQKMREKTEGMIPLIMNIGMTAPIAKTSILNKLPLRTRSGYSNVPVYDNPLLLGRDWQTKIKNPVEAYTKIPTDFQTTQRAYIAGGAAGKPDDEVIQLFKDWVNSRRASKIQGMIKGQEFADLDAKGLKGILEFQAGEKVHKGLNLLNTERYKDVKSYFDKLYSTLQHKGIEFNYKQDYLPQLWVNSRQEIEKVFGRKLGLRPQFTLQAIFEDYQTGINAGLKPKFTKISDLVSWYETRAQTALANKSFFDYLGRNGIIQPATKAPSDWVTISPDRFPQFKTRIEGEGVYTGTYKAPEELAQMINSYLSEPSFTKLQQVANFASQSKNRLLSFGIPNTGLNFHGFNVLARSYMEAGPSGALKTAEYMINPNAAQRYIDANITKAPDAIKHGLTFSTSERASSLETESFLKGLGKKWNEWFEAPLFDKIVGAKKLESYQRVWQSYAKSMPEKAAKQEAAKFINTIYGGINLDEIARSKDMQNFMRAVLLTPDWLESNLRLGGNIVKAALQPSNPTGQAYRKVLTNLVGGYVGLNIINKLTSGHLMIENDPGHTFELEMGYTPDGQKRYFRPFGTAADFVRIPFDAAVSLLQGDPSTLFRALRNRLSTLVGPSAALLTNTNWQGQAVYGRDKYGNPMTPLQSVAGIGSELGTMVGFPSFAQRGLDFATGRTGLEQSALQMVELPVRYSGGAYSPAQKTLKEASGLKGKELYELLQKTRNQPLSSEEKEAQQFRKKSAAEEAKTDDTARRIFFELKKLPDKESKLARLKEYEKAGVWSQEVRDAFLSFTKAQKKESLSDFGKAVLRSGQSNEEKARFIKSYFSEKNLTPDQKLAYLVQLENDEIWTKSLRNVFLNSSD